MSRHFNRPPDLYGGSGSGVGEPQRFRDTVVRFLRWRPETPEQLQWAKHAYWRFGFLCAFMAYEAYWHPEYSFISAWWHGSSEPLLSRTLPPGGVEPRAAVDECDSESAVDTVQAADRSTATRTSSPASTGAAPSRRVPSTTTPVDQPPQSNSPGFR